MDNPYDVGPSKIVVMKNVRTSPIEHLFNRGRLGPEETAFARLLAAREYNRIWHQAEIGGARAIDYSRVKVDISFSYRGVPTEALEAITTLAAIRRRLGRHYGLVEAVCGAGRGIYPVSEERAGGNHPSRWAVKDTTRQLCDGLDGLIAFFGVASGRERGTIVAERMEVGE